METSKYKINNQEYPRVSSILGQLDKAWMAPWVINLTLEHISAGMWDVLKCDIGTVQDEMLQELLEESKTAYKKESEKALSIGSEVHNRIEFHIKQKIHGLYATVETKEPEIAVKKGFEAFLEWEEKNVANWFKSEVTVHHPDMCYAGTADAVAEMKNGKVYLIDFKTSKAFYSEMEMQLAAYRKCYEMNYNCIIDGIGILRLDKITGRPFWKDVTKNYERKLQAFHSLVDYYYLSANRRIKNVRTAK